MLIQVVSPSCEEQSWFPGQKLWFSAGTRLLTSLKKRKVRTSVFISSIFNFKTDFVWELSGTDLNKKIAVSQHIVVFLVLVSLSLTDMTW